MWGGDFNVGLSHDHGSTTVGPKSEERPVTERHWAVYDYFQEFGLVAHNTFPIDEYLTKSLPGTLVPLHDFWTYRSDENSLQGETYKLLDYVATNKGAVVVAGAQAVAGAAVPAI